MKVRRRGKTVEGGGESRLVRQGCGGRSAGGMGPKSVRPEEEEEAEVVSGKDRMDRMCFVRRYKSCGEGLRSVLARRVENCFRTSGVEEEGGRNRRRTSRPWVRRCRYPDVEEERA